MASNSTRRWPDFFGSSPVHRTPSLKWQDILLLALACMLCFMQVVHPFMCDHEIYARGGKVLLDGGHFYTDFIDVKPPLIYELFALCMAVFGSSMVALRMMDVFLQLVVVVLMFRTVFSHTGSRVMAHGASLAFGAYIASLWFPVMLHPETLAFLPILLLIRFGAKTSRSWSDALVLGIVSGILFSLKYTLLLPAIPVIWMFARQSGSTWKMLIVAATSFAGVVAIVFSIVWYDGIVGAMQQIATFLAGYGSATGGLTETLITGLNNVSDFIANDTSLLLTTLALTAVIAGMIGRGRRDALFVTTVTVLVALALSIILERKFNHAHMPRLIPAMAILVGYGLPVVWRACTRAWQNRTFGIATLLFMALIAIILSPLPRMLRTAGTFVKVAVQGISWREATHTSNDGLLDLVAMDSALAVVTASKPRSLVVLGLGGTLLYWYVPDVKKSKFADSHFFTSPYAPGAWNADALREAGEADIIVMQDDDVHPRLTGYNASTRSVLMQRPEWIALFNTRHLLRDDGKWSVWKK